ncbi:phosphatase PAP2 family protein [Salinimicrobium sediminilitoris]|uniref:phosphatase PAP2 family protein n=1 Tax=Salinimicrobium sediminilitoris TaxID=2876715 RepID=UPI001E31F1EF|nr:phosphatase PAP2 family protein [Salinimicrobium sediminilitoris]MCC8360407.1 phosphatase PAP2 family protein [Salinimicrobium sediminilitoris]
MQTRFIGNKNITNQFLVVLILLFISLSALVYFFPPTFIDIKISKEIQDEHGAIENLMIFISWFGGTIKVLSLSLGAACVFYFMKYVKEALFIASTMLVSVVNYGFKLLIDRPRPDSSLVNILQDAEHHSFPSGHTSFYVVYFGFLIFLMIYLKIPKKRLRSLGIFICAFLIATIPFSRIYLGVHWVTDVIGGFVLGLIMLIIIIQTYLSTKSSKIKK